MNEGFRLCMSTLNIPQSGAAGVEDSVAECARGSNALIAGQQNIWM